MPDIRASLRSHWPEYLIEGALLGLFMVSANFFGVLLSYPDSPLWVPHDLARRLLGGLAMGVTAIGIIYSPWGQRSGAHLNPALTLAFLRLRKVKPWDALFYIVAQFIGGVSGVLVSQAVLGKAISHPFVNYAVTIPGPPGTAVAFLAELLISGGMMSLVLFATNTPRAARFTGLLAGCLIFLYIAFESPLSGMSMNPARSTASALPSGVWTSAWIYFIAPVAGMLLASEVYVRRHRRAALACPKFHHGLDHRCIFCGHPGAPTGAGGSVRPL